MPQGEYRVFDEIWRRTDLFYRADDVQACRTFAELWEAVKFRRLAEILPATPQRALEVGCGSGGASLFLHDRYGYSVTLVDLSDEALALAGRNFRHNSTRPEVPAAFVKADACVLPFPPATFDLVMSFGLLEHFPDIIPPIAEQMRVLRPGGFFLADVVTRRFSVDSFSRFPARVKRALGLRRGRWWEMRALGRAELYENRFPLALYLQIVQQHGGRILWARGNRPVTSLNLPVLGRLALRLYKTPLLQRLWRRFDRSDLALTRFWGAGWWILAVKE